jgi:hypothetical protein
MSFGDGFTNISDWSSFLNETDERRGRQVLDLFSGLLRLSALFNGSRRLGFMVWGFKEKEVPFISNQF